MILNRFHIPSMKERSKKLYFVLFFLLFIFFFFFHQASSLLASTQQEKLKSKKIAKKTISTKSSKGLSKSSKGKSFKKIAKPQKKEKDKDFESSNIEVLNEKATTYRVKKGDNLYRIAKKFGLSPEELMAMNGLSGTALKIGQILIIKRKEANKTEGLSEHTTTHFERTPTKDDQTHFLEHKVSKGETLFSISKKYGITVGEILEANGLSDITIREGMVLRIPKSEKTLEQPKEEPKEQKELPKDQKFQVEPQKSQSKVKDENSKNRYVEKKVYHVVKKGETLASIARKYHTTPEELKRLNRLKTARLKPGQKLLVRIEKEEEIKLAFSLTSKVLYPSQNEPYIIHRVKEGETLYRISLMYGVSIEEIKLLNDLEDNIILVGQELKIPAQAYEKAKLVEPKTMFKAEEEPLAEKFKRITLGKEEAKALRDRFLEISRAFSNARYRLGGEGRNALDCSAFVQQVYNEFGIKLPRSSYQQFMVGLNVEKDELMPGDLVFFKTSNRAPVTHVGIYLGDNKFVHVSSKRKGLAIDSMDDPYLSSRFVGAKRILNEAFLKNFKEHIKENQAKKSVLQTKNAFDVLN